MQSSEQDIWAWQPKLQKCTGKHAWVRYISMNFRECAVCSQRERLWADFGIVKKHKPD
uniref:Uncharacterized protein n=1 Tax=Pseudomonas phage Touem01 TaxID=3138548 RepID=A0AAU6W228_9VIRU